MKIKNEIKKISFIIAAFSFVISAFQIQPKAQEVQKVSSDQKQLITGYVSSLGSENNNWLEYYAPSLRQDYRDFIDSDSKEGLLSIDKSEPFFITKIDNIYSPKFNELAYFYEDGSYESYLVGETLKVDHENEFFYDGDNYRIITVVKENNEWYIGAETGVTDEVLEKYNAPRRMDAEKDYYLRTGYGNYSEDNIKHIGYGFVSPGNEPSSISVMLSDKKTIVTTTFSEFIKNVTQNEVGNMGFKSDAICAQAMSAKMAGWWAHVAKYRSSYGCDIKYGDVTYIKETSPNNSVRSAYSTISSYKMTASNGKLFYAAYVAGSQNANGKHGGVLKQNGAQYLAKTYNYSWKKILHYYYDDSSYNNPDTETVVIS